MRRVPLIAAVLAALLAAGVAAGIGSASGRGPAPRLHLAPTSQVRGDAGLQRMLDAADAHWRRRVVGRLPAACGGGIDVHQGGPAQGLVAGFAVPPCRIWLNPTAWSPRAGRWRASLCDVVVHEVGHLLGLEHAPAGTDVMSPELPGDGRPRAPECAVP